MMLIFHLSFVFYFIVSRVNSFKSLHIRGSTRNVIFKTSSNKQNIENDFDWSEISSLFDDNIPAVKKQNIVAENNNPIPSSKAKEVMKDSSIVSSKTSAVVSNKNWRSAMIDNDRKPKLINKPQIVTSKVSQDLDFDYADLEEAMWEEENDGSFIGNKRSSLQQNNLIKRLETGHEISSNIWTSIFDSEMKPYSFSRVEHVTNDILVIFADPRRMTEEFKILLDQFNKIPKDTLKCSLLAVNCDDANDIRKYLKKHPLPYPFLCDPNRKLMDELQCRVDKRISSALLMVKISSGLILKIWYENDWDPFTTKVTKPYSFINTSFTFYI